ncbi:MAG: hypothetical protein IT537_08475 [Hyphomicrobiales bacterium]|nr:hypothetical protein [Hyphomicrobiales bacterium]
MKPPRINVGDIVRPKPEWIGDPNMIPSGRVRQVERFGAESAIYVDGERRAFQGYVFEVVAVL